MPIRLLCDEEELARVSTPTRRERLKSTDVQASLDKSRQARVLDPKHRFTLDLDVTSNTAQASAAAILHHVTRVIARDFGSVVALNEM